MDGKNDHSFQDSRFADEEMMEKIDGEKIMEKEDHDAIRKK